MNSKCRLLLLLILLAAGLNACRFTKRVAKGREVITDTTTHTIAAHHFIGPELMPVDTADGGTVAAPDPNAKALLIAQLSPLYNRSYDFSTFSGKAKMHYEGKGEEQDFSSFIKIEKDRKIWINISALGGIVQVLRALITPDSVIAVNHLDKVYYKLPFSEIRKILPAAVDFMTLQDVILGRALGTGGQVTDANATGGSLALSITNSDFEQQLGFSKTDSTLLQQQVLGIRDTDLAILFQYGSYESPGGHPFADKRTINISKGAEQFFLDMDFTSAEFDQQLDFPFSIPSKYKLKQL